MDRVVRPQYPSIKLDQLVYVELDASNGGMMLTVSEEGFSFRAVSPVRTISRTPFSFVINGADKLEGFGKIEWIKDDGKVAGLLFTDVTTQFLNSLRVWLAALCTPPAALPPSLSNSSDISYRPSYHSSTRNNGEPVSAVEQPGPQLQNFERPVVEQIAFARLREPVMRPPFTELALNLEQPLTGETSHNNGTARISAPAVSVAAAPMASEWSYREEPPTSSGFVIVTAIVCVLGLAILLYSYREVLGQTLISLGQKLSTTSETSQSQTPKTAEPPKPVEEPRPAATPVAERPVPQASTPPQAGVINDSKYSVRDDPSAVKPESTFQDARRDSTGAATGTKGNLPAADPADQVRTLWSAVSQGNTSAEVTLAKLYLIGGGVPKSCDQAKVLLQAAAKKGNGEAIDKLSQISQQGCP